MYLEFLILYQCYNEIVTEFEVANKITGVVTDSAADMVKAFTPPGYAIDEDDEEEKTVVDLEPMTVDMTELVQDSILCNAAEVAPVPERVPCFAHRLQLAVKDGLKDAGQLKAVISKVSSFVSFVRKSHHASELLEKCNKLQLANATRWNSQLKMIRSVLQVPDNMEKINFSGKPKAHEMK